MKYSIQLLNTIFFLSLLTLSISCGSAKCNDKLIVKDCPPDGKCSVTIHKNKSLFVKTDDLGKLLYELQDNANKDIAVYTYDRTPPKDVMDGSYREEVIVELDKGQQTIVLSGGLSKSGTKVLFGRFCYCKGFTGYYKIASGNLTALDESVYSVDFKVTEVPQILEKIQFSIK